MVHSVPVMSGSTPKSGLANVGAHRVPVRKSQDVTSRKNARAGMSRETKMPIVMRTERPAAALSRPIAMRSPTRRLAAG